MNDVFISYQHAERDFAEILHTALQDAGFSAWYDQRIDPGSNPDSVIVDQLLRSHTVVALVTQAALTSAWANFEWALAFRTNKMMLIVNLDPRRIQADNLPSYLRSVQILRHEYHFTIDNIIDPLRRLNPPQPFWSSLSKSPIDICLPKGQFKTPKDKKIGIIDGVSITGVNAALKLQKAMFLTLGPITRERNHIGIRFLPERCELPLNRNHIILSGPGRMPIVHHLLTQWAGLMPGDALISGYRFVTHQNRPFKPGPFLKPDNKTGIEDVQEGKRQCFFPYKRIGLAAAGRNYAIIYTRDLGRHTNDESKFVIVAALTRQVLGGVIDFLINREENYRWFTEVENCGSCTETLIEFSVGPDGTCDIENRHHARTLGTHT